MILPCEHKWRHVVAEIIRLSEIPSNKQTKSESLTADLTGPNSFNKFPGSLAKFISEKFFFSTEKKILDFCLCVVWACRMRMKGKEQILPVQLAWNIYVCVCV